MTSKNFPPNHSDPSIATHLSSFLACTMLALFALFSVHSAEAQVTGMVNIDGPTATNRGDGEPLSAYFNVSIAGTALYTYPAQVKAVNFTNFTSDLTGWVYDPNITDADPHGAYTYNQGSASFVSFQPTVSGGTNTVTVSFKVAPHTAITSASQIKLLSNVTNNLSAVTIIPPGGTSTYGGFSFTITEKVAGSTGFGIPQQITIDVGNDWLNSLQIFANPHPDTTNGVPAGAVEATASETPMRIPDGAVVHFKAGRYFIAGFRQLRDQQLYLDDGAFIKYYTYPVGHPLPARSCYVNEECGPMIDLSSATGNAGVSGWGVLDGQAQQQQAAWSTVDANGKTVVGNCGNGPGPLGLGLISNSTQTATVFGIIIENSCSFTFQVGASGTAAKPVTIDNIKIFGYSGASTPNTSNADGIDVFGSYYLNITNSFIRTSDDLITLKQTNPSLAPGAAHANTNINVVNNTLWNEVAHALVVGGETYNAYNANQPSNPISDDDVLFDSNYVVHDKGKGQLFGVVDAWGGTIQNIVFSNTVVNEAVGLLSISTSANNSGYGVTGYSMAPTTPSGSAYASVVTFTTNGQYAPVAVPGDEVLLSGFTSSQATSEAFNGQYLTVAASPAPTTTSFVATMTVPNAISSTTTGTETAAVALMEAVPGYLGAEHFCNISEINGQSTPRTINGPAPWGPGNPYVSPVSNIQVVVTRSTNNLYDGGHSTAWGTTYPRVINQPPTFYNVTVGSSTVSMATPGNGYFYKAVDGLSSTDPTPFPSTQVEETVWLHGAYGQSQYLYYYTGVPTSNPASNQIPDDMVGPQFPGSMTCLPSVLKPVPSN